MKYIHSRLLPVFCLFAVAGICVFFVPDLALAQLTPRKMPFGIGGAEGAATAPTSAIAAWILAKQSVFYQAIQSAVGAAKADGTAIWQLAGLSFAYGIFHAAGPGHGKAIIASYMIANESALKRGTMIAFLAAGLQGLVAIAIIGVIAILLHGTAKDMTLAASYIEIASYAAIFAFGLWLIWKKGRSFLNSFRSNGNNSTDPHIHGPDCDHVHMPDPALMSGRLSLREIAASVVAAGLRPCTGAILVLVFALSQGILWAGVAAVAAMSFGTAITTSSIAAMAVFAKLLALRFASGNSRSAERLMRGLELAAAIFVAMLGFGLLTGYFISQGA